MMWNPIKSAIPVFKDIQHVWGEMQSSGQYLCEKMDTCMWEGLPVIRVWIHFVVAPSLPLGRICLCLAPSSISGSALCCLWHITIAICARLLSQGLHIRAGRWCRRTLTDAPYFP